MARGVPALRWVYPTVFRAGFERGRKENPRRSGLRGRDVHVEPGGVARGAEIGIAIVGAVSPVQSVCAAVLPGDDALWHFGALW